VTATRASPFCGEKRGPFIVFMQARSSPTSYNDLYRPLKSLSLQPKSFILPTPSSPLAKYSTTREFNERRTSHRKSLCELIPEELNVPGSDLSAPGLHNNLDLSSELYKRHHKPRSILIRAQSEPCYLSTTTTRPIHIPSSKYVHPFYVLSISHGILLEPWQL
jgi:hypothetical protein